MQHWTCSGAEAGTKKGYSGVALFVRAGVEISRRGDGSRRTEAPVELGGAEELIASHKVEAQNLEERSGTDLARGRVEDGAVEE